MDQRNQVLEWVGLFFPFIGYILFMVYYENKPIQAIAIGKWSLFGLAVEVLFSIFTS